VLRAKDGDRNGEKNATEKMGLVESPRHPELLTQGYECRSQEHDQCEIGPKHLR